MAGLKDIFRKKESRKQSEADAPLIFTTSLYERPDSRFSYRFFYCLAAHKSNGDEWHVFRRRYTQELGQQKPGVSSMSSQLLTKKAYSLNEALAKLLEFEQQHEGRNSKSDARPDDALHVSQMTDYAERHHMQAAQEAAAIAVKAVKLKHLRTG